MKPPFVQLLPDDIERYGPAAAVVLSHIRYRCSTDGPGRLVADGHRWWRVARQDLGDEIGMSGKSVRNALTRLEGVVLAKHFEPLENQALAYRPAYEALLLQASDLPEAQMGQGPQPSDLPEAHLGMPDAQMGQVPCPNGPGTVPKRASAPYIENLENLEKRGRGAHASLTARAPTDGQLSANRAGLGQKCSGLNCPTCKIIRRDIDNCTNDCNDAGRILRSGRYVDCPHHGNFRLHIPKRASA